jgi:hypothetical protein
MQIETARIFAPVDSSSLLAEPWLRLFSSLSLAEEAAGKLTRWAAEEFLRSGNLELFRHYQRIADEEFIHAKLVRAVARTFFVPPDASLGIYAGQRFVLTGRARLAEVLATIHLVFEPSALAFLSYIQVRAPEFFVGSWATDVENAFGAILRDESEHIKSSFDILSALISGLRDEERIQLRRTMRTHRIFLKAGIQNFFSANDFQRRIGRELNERFDFSYQQVMKGLPYAI